MPNEYANSATASSSCVLETDTNVACDLVALPVRSAVAGYFGSAVESRFRFFFDFLPLPLPHPAK